MTKCDSSTFVARLDDENTGGNCIVTFAYLKEGRVLGITDDAVVLYRSLDHFYNICQEGDDTDVCPYFPLSYDREVLAKPDYGTPDMDVVVADCALEYVKAVTEWDGGGRAPVTCLHLADGQILGIDAESVVLYEDMAAFKALKDSASIDLCADAYYVIVTLEQASGNVKLGEWACTSPAHVARLIAEQIAKHPGDRYSFNVRPARGSV